MKIISQYKSGLLNTKADILYVNHRLFSSHQSEYLDDGQLQAVIAKKGDKSIFLQVNKFFFEEEIELVYNTLVQWLKSGVDGLLLSDYGIMHQLRQDGFTCPILAITDTTITNSKDSKVLIDSGFNGVILARELIKEEYLEIIRNLKEQCGLIVFGHQLISTSKRQLLDAYSGEVNLTFESNRIYQLREKTRQEPYLILQDESGTHIYDGKVYSILAELNEIIQGGVGYLMIDGFNLDEAVLLNVIENLDIEADNLTQGLFHTKTSDKKVETWSTK